MSLVEGMNNSGPCGPAASWPLGRVSITSVPPADNAAHPGQPGAASQAGTGATTSLQEAMNGLIRRAYILAKVRPGLLLVADGLSRIGVWNFWRKEGKYNKNQAKPPLPSSPVSLHKHPTRNIPARELATWFIGNSTLEAADPDPPPPPGHSSSAARDRARRTPKPEVGAAKRDQYQYQYQSPDPSHPRPPPAPGRSEGDHIRGPNPSHFRECGCAWFWAPKRNHPVCFSHIHLDQTLASFNFATAKPTPFTRTRTPDLVPDLEAVKQYITSIVLVQTHNCPRTTARIHPTPPRFPSTARHEPPPEEQDRRERKYSLLPCQRL